MGLLPISLHRGPGGFHELGVGDPGFLASHDFFLAFQSLDLGAYLLIAILDRDNPLFDFFGLVLDHCNTGFMGFNIGLDRGCLGSRSGGSCCPAA